jgi:O-antigen/teichoic acid export membrane protein
MVKIARSGVGWLIAEYGTLGLSLVATMYFARTLTDADAVLGLFAGFETVVSLVTVVVASGLGTALTKRVSEGDDVDAYVTAAVGVTLTLSVVGAILVLLASPFGVARFDVSYAVVGVLIVLIITKPLRNVLQAALRGLSMVGTSGGLSFVEMFVRVGVQAPLVFLGIGLLGLASGSAVGMIVSTIATLYILPVGFERPTREHLRSLFEFGKYSFFQGIAGRFYDNIDVIVILLVLGEAPAGEYSVPFRLGLALAIFSGSISNVTFPEISRHAAQENYERIEEILTDGIVFSTLLAIPATVGLAVLARPIIVTLFTEEFAGGAFVAVVAVAIQIPEGMRSVFTSGIDGMDRPDLTLNADLIVVAINLLLDLILVPTVGIIGAAIASFVAISSASFYLGYTLFSKFDLPIRSFPILPLAAETVAALAMGGVVYWLRGVVDVATVVGFLSVLPVAPSTVISLVRLAVLISVGIVVYFAVLLTISGSVRRRVVGIAGDVFPV